MINLDAIISRIKKITDTSFNKDVASLLNLSPADFSLRKKRGTLLPIVIEWAINQNVNLDWLVTGAGTPEKSETSIIEQKTESPPHEKQSSTSTIIELEHMELVKRFQDKAAGKLANEQLIELEQLSKEAFYGATNYISGALSTAKIMTNKSEKQEGRQGGKKERKEA